MQGFPFEAVPSKFEESLAEFKVAWECAEANAVGKAQEVADRLKVRVVTMLARP